ncbi:ABC transporter permease [Corynebacterium sp. 335C]
MTAPAATRHAPAPAGHRPAPSAGPLNAVFAVAKRDTMRTVRNRAVMVSAIVIPSLFMAAFYATFSKAADAMGIDYASFLFPAGIIQAIVFTAAGSSLPVALDHERGIHDRALTTRCPAWAIVAGRLLADLGRMVWSGGIVLFVALLLGVRFEGGPAATAALFLLFALLTIVFSAAADGLCLLTRKPSSTATTLQGLVLVIIMFSTAFVPADALPDAVAPIIRHVPLSPILDTARDLIAGNELGGTAVEAACWLVALTAVAAWGFTTALSRRSDA